MPMNVYFTQTSMNRQAGFNLMEILVAVVVFAVGMLALASLQGALTRSSAEANARTVAHNLVEEIIEDRRGFGLMGSDGTDMPAYLDITDSTYQQTRGGLAFTITEAVTDYYYDRVNNATIDDFSTTNELDKFYPDLKVLTVTVAWSGQATPDFVIDENTSISAANMGSGQISVSTVVKSATSSASAMVQSQESNNQIAPLNPYSPGARPDVIGLALGDDRFKESLTPVPDVISRDELVETNFDVITYSQTGDDSVFLRQENFKSVTCECALGDGNGSMTGTGRRPTLWAADEYEEGEWVTKTVGVSDNNNQSFYCDVCCRDHHDGGTGEKDDANDEGRSLYDPWRPRGDVALGETNDYHQSGAMQGNHKHYGYNQAGALIEATTVGAHYEESCRMVRVDGFWRVIHDFRQEGLNVFPWDYFNYDANADVYSEYVTRAVASMVGAIGEDVEYHWQSPLDTLPAPAAVLDAGDDLPSSTSLPTWQAADTQQLRSRGIYLDFMSAEVRDVLNCLSSDDNTVEDCSKGGSGVSANNTIELDAIGSDNYLEAIPFFDVQLTWLDRWTENPINSPVDTTNEPVADDNAHSRGVASLEAGPSSSTVTAFGHRGNLGFTDTDPIDLRYNGNVTEADMTVQTLSTVPAPPPGTVQVSGSITSGVSGVQASKVDIEASDASCQRTGTGYTCWITGSNPRMTLSGYNKNNVNTVACSDNMTESQNNDNANDPRAVFSLDSLAVGTAIADIVIYPSASCPAA